MLASISFDEGNCAEAANYYKAAAVLMPDVGEIRYDLGLSYFCDKKFALAKPELESASSIHREGKADRSIFWRCRPTPTSNSVIR